MRLLAFMLLAVSVSGQVLPRFPYGAVYFRKTNPPREDWERDYARAAKDGMNTFRHWFMWGSIEVEPGKFDWADYDAQLDLAAKYGIKTIVAEVVHSAPEWAFNRFAHAQFVLPDGRKSWSGMRNSSVTGGFPGLCLDNDDYKEAAGKFLTELAARYRKHPGMGGYDIWNECNLNSSGAAFCFCPGTTAKFREWLQRKYGDVKTLGKAWNRFSYTSWDDVLPPRAAGLYPDYMDWIDFRLENTFRLMKWRADVIRKADPDHPISAHGMYDSTIDSMVSSANEHWRAGALVDIYGFTGISSQEDREEKNSKRWSSVDMTRAGARGKAFWAAETSGGPHWMQPKGARDGGRIPGPGDIRLAQFIIMSGGTTGIFSPRWRPLLDGPLFGAYALYGMDGSPTPNSDMASRIAKWANSPATEELWKSRPVRGEVGIVVAPESQVLATLLHEDGSTRYSSSTRGAYEAFFDAGIQADYVNPDDIGGYDLLYLPYPLMLSEPTIQKLKAWVERGGSLVSEACPGYFSMRGRAGTVQPNFGLDRLFGAREESVEFTPDLLEKLTFRIGEKTGIAGANNIQTFRTTGGTAAGWYADGRIAVVDHTTGKGKTRLIGTHPGAGYQKQRTAATREFFAGLLAWAGKEPHTQRNNQCVARLHDGPGGTYLWLVNHKTASAKVELKLSSQWGPFRSAELLWGETKPAIKGHMVEATVPALDAVVVKLVR